MPVWEPNDDLSHAVDFRLVSNTFVSMFFCPAVLDSSLEWLLSHGYDVRTVNAASWASQGDMHRDLALVLEFPDYYGHNLAALNDCMSDIAAADHAAGPGSMGLVLALRNFEAFAAVDRHSAQLLLDIFATQARNAALFGNRMICLLQSNDPRISFDPVGAVPVLWNDAEWLDSNRGL